MTETKQGWQLVIHGGAGIIERAKVAPEIEREVRAALGVALDAGQAILAIGGSAIDAVEAAVQVLEDDPHFNAGRGAVLTYEGIAELDAAIMDGRGRAAGAVSRAATTRHPVSLARAAMTDSPHVMLSGAEADRFAADHGLEQVPNDWFVLRERRRQLAEMKASRTSWFDVDMKYGTVGAVALDAAGHVAAATSTGGITGKRWGRIGDSPLIGAGTYADDRAAAISATGSGEHFIRTAAAHEICARVRLAGESAQAAADAVMAEVKALGGTGGVIFVGPGGDAGWSFVSPGMYRARAWADGRMIAMFRDEP